MIEDKEISSMRTCASVLVQLDPSQQDRVIMWLVSFLKSYNLKSHTPTEVRTSKEFRSIEFPTIKL